MKLSRQFTHFSVVHSHRTARMTKNRNIPFHFGTTFRCFDFVCSRGYNVLTSFPSPYGVVQQQIVQIDLNWISSSSSISIACNSNSNVVYLLNVIVSILYARKRWFSIQLRFFAEKCAHTPWSKLNIIQYECEWCIKRIQINANICALSARHIHCAI